MNAPALLRTSAPRIVKNARRPFRCQPCVVPSERQLMISRPRASAPSESVAEYKARGGIVEELPPEQFRFDPDAAR